MKKILILSMAAFLVFGLTSWAAADLVLTDPYTVGPISAQFFAIDNLGTSGDNYVTLSNISFTPGYTLQYNVGPAWININPYSTFTVGTTDHRQLVQLRLFAVSGGNIITTATMAFSGQYAQNSPLYNNVQLIFGGAEFLFESVTAAGTDKVAPVPLPAAVWLLGAGLVGLVGVRRKIPALKA